MRRPLRPINPATPRWGDQITLESAATEVLGFGVTEPDVWLLRGAVPSNPMALTVEDYFRTGKWVKARLPASPPASGVTTWWIRAPEPSCTPVPVTIVGGVVIPNLPVKKLTLQRLYCRTTEDNTRDDSVWLENTGRKDIPLKKILESDQHDINDKETWTLNSGPYPFVDTVKISLYDDDWIDPDDHLGTVEISAKLDPGEFEDYFTGDDADYTLFYKIENLV